MEMLPDCNRLSGIGSPMPLSLPQLEGELKLSKKRWIPVIKLKSGIQGKGLNHNLFPMSLTHFDKQIADALQKLNESKPDVLIADIGMPQIDGYMLIRQFRQLSTQKGGEIPAPSQPMQVRQTNSKH
jgi:CheY-like chemotaxis protein